MQSINLSTQQEANKKSRFYGVLLIFFAIICLLLWPRINLSVALNFGVIAALLVNVVVYTVFAIITLRSMLSLRIPAMAEQAQLSSLVRNTAVVLALYILLSGILMGIVECFSNLMEAFALTRGELNNFLTILTILTIILLVVCSVFFFRISSKYKHAGMKGSAYTAIGVLLLAGAVLGIPYSFPSLFLVFIPDFGYNAISIVKPLLDIAALIILGITLASQSPKQVISSSNPASQTTTFAGSVKTPSLNNQRQKSSASTEIVENIPETLKGLGEKLSGNGIVYSVYSSDSTDSTAAAYRQDEILATQSGFQAMPPYLIIETTQLFSNSNCAMTYLQKDWRANPFVTGDLGTIDISATGSYEHIYISSLLPRDSFMDREAKEQLKERIEASIAQGQGLMKDIKCEEYFENLYIILRLEISDPGSMTTEQVFSLIQLYALEVHRIFGSITVPSGKPVQPSKSTVEYTPDIVDADGGYFVYSLNGHLWWVIDKDKRFKSVAGKGIWKEFKDAEAEGLPLTAIDMDNLYNYRDGIVYDLNNNAVGQYFAQRQ